MSGYRTDKLIRELYNIINTIENVDVRDFTMTLVQKAPQLNWEKRASISHHPKDERGKFGNLIHTIRVARTVIVMSESTPLSTWERDILVSAAVLHDCCRYGLDGKAEFSVPEHPHLVKKLARTCGVGVLPQVFEIIEAHMGRWGTPAFIPHLDLKTTLHLADALCAHLGDIEEVPE